MGVFSLSVVVHGRDAGCVALRKHAVMMFFLGTRQPVPSCCRLCRISTDARKGARYGAGSGMAVVA